MKKENGSGLPRIKKEKPSANFVSKAILEKM